MPNCTPVTDVAPATLYTQWPNYIDHHVRFPARVVRTLGATEALIVANSTQFAVLLAPGQLWQGTQVHTFTVVGQTNLNLAGPITLPQLLFEDCK